MSKVATLNTLISFVSGCSVRGLLNILKTVADAVKEVAQAQYCTILHQTFTENNSMEQSPSREADKKLASVAMKMFPHLI
jgi:hypothetical protein